MKIRNILLISTTAILLTGCFATTSANLEKQNFMNKFKIEKDYKSAAKYTYEMFQICRTNNLLTYKNDIYENVGKAEGTAITVKKFIRFETGEGIAKKEENFAEEVAKQMGM